MDQENKFGEYWKKFLVIWHAFLTQCGVIWEKAKIVIKKVLARLRWYADKLFEVLAEYAGKGGVGLKKLWKQIRINAKKLLQKLAAWLLEVREKVGPKLQQAGAWFAGLPARLHLQNQKETKALPAAPEEQETASGSFALPTAEAETADEEVSDPKYVPVEKNEPEWMSIPWVAKTLAVLGVIGTGLKFVITWIWKLRRIIMAIPVIWFAVKFAMQNADRLPESVGLDIQATGEFATMISRTEAVWWPLGITAFCLVLMFCSRKPLLPWVISIFTLVLPWLIWLLNYYA